MRDRLAATDVDWIVAADAMTTLVGFVRSGHVGAAMVRPLVEVQLDHRSASVRRHATRHLDALTAG